MSIRVLIEVNGDKINSPDISRHDLAAASYDPEARERLRRVGVFVLSERHHASVGQVNLKDWEHNPYIKEHRG